MAEYGKGPAKGYGDFLKMESSAEDEQADITQMSPEDKKKLAIKKRLAKMRKAK